MARVEGETVSHCRRITQGARARMAGAAALAAIAACVAAAPGPDVPYVPTAPNVVEAMLALAKVGPRDYVVDLGSGDGRIVIAAARRHGAHGFGVDVDEDLVARAREAAKREGVADRVNFFARNFFLTDISRATVLTMYLFPSINLQLRPRLFAELRPGTRVVSHDFDMAQWQPDAELVIPVPDKPYGAPESRVFLWIIPANAAGAWRGSISTESGSLDFEAELTQTFQMLSGTARIGSMAGRVRGGALHGEALRFALSAEVDGRHVRHEFEGRVSGDTIAGRMKAGDGVVRDWRAGRIRRAAIDITPPLPDL